MSVFDDKTIGIQCPKCGHKHQKTIGWLKANNNLIVCACSVTIRLDKDEFVKSLRELDDAIERIPRNIVINL